MAGRVSIDKVEEAIVDQIEDPKYRDQPRI
jgi:hypothetical protein